MQRTNEKIKGFPCATKSRNINPNDLSALQLLQYENDDAVFLDARRFYYEKATSNKQDSESQKRKQEFDALIKEWVSAIKYKSLESQQVNHDAFFRLIAIGKDVLPSVFEEFSKRPFMAWLRALPAITGKNIASEAKSFPEAVKLWVEWAKENGYLPK